MHRKGYILSAKFIIACERCGKGSIKLQHTVIKLWCLHILHKARILFKWLVPFQKCEFPNDLLKLMSSYIFYFSFFSQKVQKVLKKTFQGISPYTVVDFYCSHCFKLLHDLHELHDPSWSIPNEKNLPFKKKKRECNLNICLYT